MSGARSTARCWWRLCWGGTLCANRKLGMWRSDFTHESRSNAQQRLHTQHNVAAVAIIEPAANHIFLN
uniref:Putative secreted protein n=1 Tax=Anopheles triannulatus TaxID=58253 RepID=A0A2M4B4J9_9DIPT